MTPARMRAAALALAFLSSILSSIPTASADDNDLVLARLATVKGDMTGVVPDNQAFRSLTSELGVIFTPRNTAPADTLGFSGFQFTSQFSFTTISNDQAFWCATEESENCNPGFEKSGIVPTVGLFARKGFWFPLPSFEVGAGAIHIFSSRLWSGQAYAKFALHEGYHGWPIPSLAVRGAVGRLFGVEQLDLTNASLDISVSKRIGIQGTFSLAPYLGYAFLWIIPRSQVIDKTPNVAVKDNPEDIKMNFVFADQDNIVRHRVFAGLKAKYYVFAVTLEVDVALAGDSVDDRDGITTSCDMAPASEKDRCDATDQSGSQPTYSLAVSLDF
jgi:hypothetical protein